MAPHGRFASIIPGAGTRRGSRMPVRSAPRSVGIVTKIAAKMPFRLADLETIRVRVGMGTKSLREMSDTQFTAWLRARGARGEIGVVKTGPGELMIPIGERAGALNDL